MDAIQDQFDSRLRQVASQTEAILSALLDPALRPDETARPERLREAMSYAVLNGGKRLRPFLVLESARLFGADEVAALRVGAALECLHCYSLVHDDLPAMDDDDMRRGKPTVHIAFDEATAILAGDSLLTYAFDIIAAPETELSAEARLALVLMLARAAGLGGMAGGQALDLLAEREAPDEEGVITLQAMKTGALIRFACEAGAVIAGAPQEERLRLRRFGELIGRAFQVADDLLDLTSDAATLGKATGKDAARGKATLVGMRGQAWAVTELDRLVREASALLEPFGPRAAILQAAARYVAGRST